MISACNLTNTVSSVMVGMTRTITHMLCVYDLTTSFNRRAVSRVATVLDSY